MLTAERLNCAISLQLKRKISFILLLHSSTGALDGKRSYRLKYMSSVSLSARIEHRLTQPPTLSGMGNEYLPKGGDALRLRSKAEWFIPHVDKRVGGR